MIYFVIKRTPISKKKLNVGTIDTRLCKKINHDHTYKTIYFTYRVALFSKIG